MNKKIRELIYEECLKRQQSYISNEMSDIFFVQENLSYYDLFEGYDLIIPLYEINMLLLNLFYDLNYKSKVNILNETDEILFSKISNASSFSELIELLEKNIDMQKRSAESVRNFVTSNGLSKCLLLKSVDEKLSDKLQSILPQYIEDKKSYDKKITKDKLINIYDNTKKFYEKKGINSDPMKNIKNYIMMLKVIRNDEYNELIKEFDELNDENIDEVLEKNINYNKTYTKNK